jgi:hypothetical protein
MFGGFGAARALHSYRKAMAQAKTAKRRTVSKEELIGLLVMNGTNGGEAVTQANISESHGGAILVGGEMLTVKAKKKRVKAKRNRTRKATP